MLHAANLRTSGRLQRVHALLSDGAEHSTRDIVMGAEVMAVNSVIAELRANGCAISCRQTRGRDGSRVCFYKMLSGPSLAPAQDPS